jgi:Flp pilus assembly protein TadB
MPSLKNNFTGFEFSRKKFDATMSNEEPKSAGPRPDHAREQKTPGLEKTLQNEKRRSTVPNKHYRRHDQYNLAEQRLLSHAKRREAERGLTEEEIVDWLVFGLWSFAALNFALRYLDHGTMQGALLMAAAWFWWWMWMRVYS